MNYLEHVLIIYKDYERDPFDLENYTRILIDTDEVTRFYVISCYKGDYLQEVMFLNPDEVLQFVYMR